MIVGIRTLVIVVVKDINEIKQGVSLYAKYTSLEILLTNVRTVNKIAQAVTRFNTV